MEGAGNSRKCSPLFRALVLITIALASIPYADADCTSPPADLNAAFSTAGKSSWTPGESVTYTCSANFQVVTATAPVNTYTRICSGTTWAAASPSACVAIACRTVPPILPNATPIPNTNNQLLNVVVTYTCTSGTIIAAGITMYTYTCQLKSGSTFEAEWAWTPGQAVTNPECKAPVCPAAAPNEANAVAGTPTGTSAGSTITYTCTNGNQVVSGSTPLPTFTRTCTGGAWAAASPAGCTVLQCLTAPPTDTNAPAPTVTIPAALLVTHTYTCNTNFVVAIGDPGYVRICQQKTGSVFEAEWALNANEPSTASCIAFGCPTTATVMTNAVAGTVTLPSTGGEVTYTCKSGYQAVTGTTPAASFKATCVGTTWTPGVTAGCTVNKCLIQPSTDANAPVPSVTVPATLGTMYTYTCNTNFVVVVGDPGYVKICGPKASSTYEAEWKLQTGEPAGATCVAVMCTTASLPATDTNATPGTPSSTTVNGMVTYTCKTGFQVVPATGTTPTATYTRACSSTGWGAANPATCTAIKCLTVPPTDTGAPAPPASTAPAALTTAYTYTCSANFVVAIGDTSYARICKQKSGSTFEGEWVLNTGEPTTAKCVAYNCASATAPTARTNAVAGSISLNNGGQVTYTCNANNQYVAAGTTTGAASFTIICTSNVWPTSPTGCTATACLTAPRTESNAPAPSVTLPAAANSAYTYTCNSGFVVAVSDNTFIKICQITSSASYQATWVLKATEPTGATCSAFSCPTTAPARDNAVAGTIITSGGGSITYTCKSGNEYKVGSTITSTFTIKCTSSAWPNSPTGCTGKSLRGWEIALIVIGVLLAVGGLILLSCLCWWYNKNKSADPSDLRQLQVDPRSQDYAYPPGMGGMGGPPPSRAPPYSRGYGDMAPFQPYSTRSIDAARYNTKGNYIYGSKPDLPY